MGEFGGGSSFTPGEMFPGDVWGKRGTEDAEKGKGNVWESGVKSEGVWSRVAEGMAEEERGRGKFDVWGNHARSEGIPEGRFVDVWSLGGSGVAEEVVSPDVVEKPIVGTPSSVTSTSNSPMKSATDTSEATSEVVTTLDLLRPLDETEADATLVEPSSQVDTEESRISDAGNIEETAQKGMEEVMKAHHEDVERIGQTEALDMAEAVAKEERNRPTANRIQPVEDNIQFSESGVTTSTSASAFVSNDVPAPAFDAAAPLTNNDATELLGNVAPGSVPSTNSFSMNAKTPSDVPISSTRIEASVLIDASSSTDPSSDGALAGASAPETFTPDSESTRQARPARDKLFLDLTGAPADTVDSGYTGSCDDRTVAAFVALDGLAE